MATDTAANRSDRSFFDTEALSDVKVKFSGQQLFCHKTVLARKSEYFYRAFTCQFPVALSNEIDLGDDDDPEAVRAMIRHIYDLPYDQMLEANTSDDTAAYSTNEDLLYHIAVFNAADKYDFSTLRHLVVKKFEDLMETTWEGDQFATAVQKLTGPSAGHPADNTLQTAAAGFCAKNLTKLIKKETFVKMIQEEEPFTGRLLAGFFNREGGVDAELNLKVCMNCKPAVEQNMSAYLHLCFCCKIGSSDYRPLQVVGTILPSN
ncbi:hypothetical protein D6C82_06752 [Aureobasidium pullulans]|nr:hypothetical protein D6C82_06752 [Aureobasidium pullulans]